jgi:hypothetical protein
MRFSGRRAHLYSARVSYRPPEIVDLCLESALRTWREEFRETNSRSAERVVWPRSASPNTSPDSLPQWGTSSARAVEVPRPTPVAREWQTACSGRKNTHCFRV